MCSSTVSDVPFLSARRNSAFGSHTATFCGASKTESSLASSVGAASAIVVLCGTWYTLWYGYTHCTAAGADSEWGTKDGSCELTRAWGLLSPFFSAAGGALGAATLLPASRCSLFPHVPGFV
jgi:hypothetical protein